MRPLSLTGRPNRVDTLRHPSSARQTVDADVDAVPPSGGPFPPMRPVCAGVVRLDLVVHRHQVISYDR